MFFDTTIQVVNTEFLIDEENSHLQVAYVVALALNGPQGAVPMPVGVVRVPMRKDMAIEKFKEGISVAESIPDAPQADNSDIVVAQSMQGVEKIAAMDQKLKSKK